MATSVERLRLPVPDAPVAEVTAAVHRPDRPRGPAVLLVHGAGGDLDGGPLVALADTVAVAGHLVVRANLPFREAGRASAPRADLSVRHYAAIAAAARDAVAPDRGWILGGKSYGGRVASMAVATGTPAVGLLFYGYPLHPPGKPERLRVDHWPDVEVPCLFLQGTRDPFCDLDRLRDHLDRLAGDATLHVVDGGDHSLRITRAAAPDGRARAEAVVLAGLDATVADWIASIR